MAVNHSIALQEISQSVLSITDGVENIFDFIEKYEHIVNENHGDSFEKSVYRGMLGTMIRKFLGIYPDQMEEYKEKDIFALARIAVLDKRFFLQTIRHMANCIANDKLDIKTRVLMAAGLAHCLQLAIPKFNKELARLYDDLNEWLGHYVKCSEKLRGGTENCTNARLLFSGLISYLEVLSFCGFDKVDDEGVRHKLNQEIVDKFKDYPDQDIRYLVAYLSQGIRRLPVDTNKRKRSDLRNVVNASQSLSFASGAIAAAAITGGIGFIGLLRVPGDILSIYDNVNAIRKRHTLDKKEKWYSRQELEQFRDPERHIDLTQVTKRELNKDFIAGILHHIQRDVVVHIANGESMLPIDNIKSIQAALVDIAHNCTDAKSDMWLFAQSVWLLCQLKREGEIRRSMLAKIQCLDKSIKRDIREFKGKLDEKEMLYLADNLLFLLNYTGGPKESVIIEKISDIIGIFLNEDLKSKTRENALKALIFLCKYEHNMYGNILQGENGKKGLLEILKENCLSSKDEAAIALIHKWLINPTKVNPEKLRTPEKYNRPKSIDESQILRNTQYSIKDAVEHDGRINPDLSLRNLPARQVSQQITPQTTTEENLGWFDWGVNTLSFAKDSMFSLLFSNSEPFVDTDSSVHSDNEAESYSSSSSRSSSDTEDYIHDEREEKSDKGKEPEESKKPHRKRDKNRFFSDPDVYHISKTDKEEESDDDKCHPTFSQ